MIRDDSQLDSAILRPIGFAGIGHFRHRLAHALLGDTGIVDAMLNQIIRNRPGSLIGQFQIVTVAADVVGMAGNVDFGVGILI